MITLALLVPHFEGKKVQQTARHGTKLQSNMDHLLHLNVNYKVRQKLQFSFAKLQVSWRPDDADMY
jgi:hypothetical protein